MGRIGYLLICAALSAGNAGVARAQGIAAEFPALWQSYLTVCGQAISDPAGVESRLTSLSPLPLKTFARSTSGNAVMLEQLNSATFESAYLQTVTLASGHWVECEVGREFGAFGNGAQVARALHGMLAGSGLMSATLGEFQPLPQSNMPIADLHDVPWFAIVVEGAFPGQQVTTIVDVDPSGVVIRMAGHVP